MNSSATSANQAARSWGNRPLSTGGTPIPKVIWSYWHDGLPPESVQIAQRSWMIHAPEYEVRMLSRQNVSEAIGRIPRQVGTKKHAAISDWIRFQALSTHGGIWMDASLVLFRPIEQILPPADILAGQPFMFFNRRWSDDSVQPMLESWLIASPKGCELLKRLLHGYSLACFSRTKYIKLMNLLFRKRILQGYPQHSYFTCFAVIQATLLRHKHLSVSMADSESGPYTLQARLFYDSDRVAQALLSGEGGQGVPAIKLTSADRAALDLTLERQRPTPSSPLFSLVEKI